MPVIEILPKKKRKNDLAEVEDDHSYTQASNHYYLSDFPDFKMKLHYLFVL
jgi:hypothetical protein